MIAIILKSCRVTSPVYEPKHSRDNDHNRREDQQKQSFPQNLLPAVLAPDPGSGDVEDRKKGGEALAGQDQQALLDEAAFVHEESQSVISGSVGNNEKNPNN